MKKGLKGKVVCITGASAGIGKATALRFAKEGAALALTYRKGKTRAREVARLCKEAGAAEVLTLPLDVMDNASIRNTVKKVVSKFGKISVLVNNAGVITWGLFKDQTFKDIEVQCRTNFEGLLKVTSAALPHVKDMIINIASKAGKRPHVELSTYCATKYGVRGFTQTLAKEVEIPVFAVNPDATRTQMSGFHGRPPEDVAEVIVNTVKGRYKVKSGGDIDAWKVLR